MIRFSGRFGGFLFAMIGAIIGSGGSAMAEEKATKVGFTLRSVKSGRWSAPDTWGREAGSEGGRPCSDRPQDARSV